MKIKSPQLYDNIFFCYDKKKCYGQILNRDKNKYKVICSVDISFYPIWISKKDITSNGGHDIEKHH